MGFLQDLGSGNIGKALGTDLTGGNSLVGQAGKGIANLSKDPLVDALAGAALMYFDPMGAVSGLGSLTNLGTAGAAGLITGGITGLASGNLGQGLKAGLAAYGGAGAENYLSNMGTTATAASSSLSDPNSLQSLTQQYPSAFRGDVGDYSPTVLPSGAGTTVPAAATNTGTISNAISSAIPQDFSWQGIKDYASEHPFITGAVGLTALKTLATPQKINPPAAKVGNIRQYSYNPYTGQMTAGPVTPANQFTGPVTAANYGATGGLVALARGGAVKRYDTGGGVAGTGIDPNTASAIANAYNSGNYEQAQNLADTAGLTAADATAIWGSTAPSAATLAAQGISLTGAAGLSAAVAANNVQAYNNPGVAGTNLSQAEIDQMQSAYGAGDYKTANTMANQYGLTQADLNAIYGSGAPTAATLAAQGITLPGSTTTANSGIAGTNLSLSAINDMYTAWQTGDYKTAQALATANGLTSQDLSDLFPSFNQNDLALAGIKLGLQPTPSTINSNGVTDNTGINVLNPAATATNAIQNTPASTLAAGVGGNTGPAITGGGTVINPNGTITTSPVEPGIPAGGWTGMTNLRNTYQNLGGSLGYTNPAPTSMDQFNQEFNTLTGGSQAAYDFLMGKTTQPKGPTKGPIGVPYFQAVGMAPKNVGFKLPNGIIAMPQSDGSYLGADGNKYNVDGSAFTPAKSAGGGLMGIHMAAGGMSVGHLGGYSDGGRLLRGPGDGVSDSIPATIGSNDPEPARLADGEFVVPARIVSELGNGSTEAGARQLYKMMDRIQTARRKTTGKDAVATNTNAHQYLPA